MAAGIVRTLRAGGVGDVYVASRTEARAVEFAQREGGKPCPIQKLSEYLVLADIVLVSAAAPDYILRPTQTKTAMAERRARALCLIDISVPRNVDPAVGDIEDVFLYDIDDLEEVAREGRREREQVAARWRPRLAEEAREVLRELEDCSVQYAAGKLLEHVNAIREEVLRQSRTAGMDQKAADDMARALERLQGRLLHHPLETLKQAGREGDGPEATAWVSRLFRLELPLPGRAGDETAGGTAGKPT
jgi:glutamyl-tRNA reductase